MDGTTGSLPSCFLLEKRDWKQIPECIYGVENGYNLKAEKELPELWRPKHCAYACRRCTAPMSQSISQPTLNPFQNTENLPCPASSLPCPHRITLGLLPKDPFCTGSPFTQTSKTQSPVWKKKTKPQTQNKTQNHSSVQKAFLKQKLTKGWALFCCLRHVNALFIHFKLFPATGLPKHFVSVGWAAPCLPWQRAHTVIWLALLSRIRW